MPSPPPPSLTALLDEAEWVRSLAYQLVGRADEADDLTQETLTQALASPPTHGGSLRGWLATILRNCVRSRHRGRVRAKGAEEIAGLSAAAAEVPSALETVERAEAHQAVVDAVMGLPEPFRSTVLLRYFEGCLPAQIAAEQGVPLATVTSRLTRAHGRLRSALGAGQDNSEGHGDRGIWLPALAPLLRPPTASSGTAGGLAGPTSLSFSLGSIILMSTALKTAYAAALVLVLALVGSSWLGQSDVATVETTPSIAESKPMVLANAVDDLKATDAGPSDRLEIGPAPTSDSSGDGAKLEEAAPESLFGTVVGWDGTPAEGATVVIGGSGSLQFLEAKKDPRKSLVLTTTDENGRFTLEEAPGERVLVTAGRFGEAPSESLIWEPGDPNEVDLALRRGIRIYGSVHRNNGTLARGRLVRLMQERKSRDPFGQFLARYIETDDQGQFDERGLCPGDWGVVTYPDKEELKEIGGAILDHMIQTTVELSDGQEAHVPLGLRGPDAVRVMGKVTLGGEPVRGLMQWIQEGPDPMGSQPNMSLNKDGTYEIELGSPGEWYMRVKGSVSGEFYLTIPAVKELEQNFALPMGGLRGVVRTADGEPVMNARVSLQVTQGAFARGPLRITEDMTYSSRKGVFSFRGLRPGDYTVGVVHDSAGVAAPKLLTIAGDQVTEDAEFVVRGSLTISGTLLGSSGFSALSSPLWIFDAEGRLLNPVTKLATSKGVFTTPSLPPGRYSLMIQSGLEVAWADDIVLGKSNVEDVEMRLLPGATVAVRSLMQGEPLKALVSVVDERGRCLTGQRYMRDPWQWRRHPFSSTTKQVGPFPPGTYTVRSWVPGAGKGENTLTLVGSEAVEVEIEL